MKKIDGIKNYLFAAAMILAAIANYFVTDLNITVLGMSDPMTLASAGIAWALGRNAIKKIETPKE